jgi:predicted dehydrogenase
MVVYDDIAPIEKIRIYDVRVERPPHYGSFGEFHYAYHYGDSFIPRIAQAEPLRRMCQHFIESILGGSRPLSCGERGLEVVRILEACSRSLRAHGAAIRIAGQPSDGQVRVTEAELEDNRLNGSHPAIVS